MAVGYREKASLTAVNRATLMSFSLLSHLSLTFIADTSRGFTRTSILALRVGDPNWNRNHFPRTRHYTRSVVPKTVLH